MHDGFRAGDRAHRADHGGAAAHVVFHFFHVIRGLDGNSAGIKRDGFSDQAQNRRARIQFFGSVRDDDHARRLDASLRDRKQRAHFQFRDFVFIEDIDGEARLSRHGGGAVGQHARRQAVRGLVAQFAREVLRFRDDAAARETEIGNGARGFFPAGQRGSRDFVPGFFVGLVFVGIEIREDHSFDDGLRRRGAAIVLAREERHALHLARFQGTHRRTGEPSEFSRSEFVFLPCAQDQQALRGQPLRVIQQGRLQHFAGQLTGSGQLRQRASGGLIELGEDALDGLLLLECVGDERVGLDLGKRAGIHGDFHKFPSLNEMAPPVQGPREKFNVLQSIRNLNPVHCLLPRQSAQQ